MSMPTAMKNLLLRKTGLLNRLRKKVKTGFIYCYLGTSIFVIMSLIISLAVTPSISFSAVNIIL